MAACDCVDDDYDDEDFELEFIEELDEYKHLLTEEEFIAHFGYHPDFDEEDDALFNDDDEEGEE
jgi:hypothetical protein